MLKESRYVRLANTMFRVLKKARIPLFLRRKSNHIFTVWQHLVLLVVRQYENKSYRMFVEWLIEAYYLRTFLQLSHIPHYTTLQKFTDRINGAILEKIISSFIILIDIRQIFFGIDSSGFKAIRASQYYVEKTKLRRRRRYVKLSVGADILYNQRNKDETIISVIKRLFGDDLTSRLTRTQNRELSFRCIAYNMHRFTNLTIIVWFLQS